jgi:hypothetical protein
MATSQQLLILLLLLQLKHLAIDWCWQPEYEWRNKGTYGHFGGQRHAMKNALGTTVCFIPFVGVYNWLALISIYLIDFILHYHIDWCKMNINRIKGWGPLTHDQFWRLTGVDQFLHQATYLFLIWLTFFL